MVVHEAYKLVLESIEDGEISNRDMVELAQACLLELANRSL